MASYTADQIAQQRKDRITQAVQQMYGTADPSIVQEASNYINSQITAMGKDPYNTIDQGDLNEAFTTALGTYSANPAKAGIKSSDAYAKMQSDKQAADLASKMSPDSALYKQYFGEGGIIPTQFQATQTSLKPAQEQAYQRLSDSLASRGLSTSGALQAGETELNKNYSQTLQQALQNLQGAGMQQLTNQAVSGNNLSTQAQQAGLQGVNEAINQQYAQNQATQLQQAKNQASGWSWLTPVLGVIGSAVGGPLGGSIGSALGLGVNAATQPAQTYAPSAMQQAILKNQQNEENNAGATSRYDNWE